MSGDRIRDALVWLGFATGDLEAARSQPGRPVRPRIVREDFERHGVSLAELTPR